MPTERVREFLSQMDAGMLDGKSKSSEVQNLWPKMDELATLLLDRENQNSQPPSSE